MTYIIESGKEQKKKKNCTFQGGTSHIEMMKSEGGFATCFSFFVSRGEADGPGRHALCTWPARRRLAACGTQSGV